MAKTKQKTSMQEMLEEAIVPKDQAPFAIPEKWCWVKLGTITEILAGGTPSRADKNYWGKGIPWVKISDMHDKFVFNTEEQITLNGLQNSSAKLLPKGTLLFSIFATIGAISILGIEACTNQAIVGLKLNHNVETSYIYFALFLLKDNIKLEGKGVAQKNINQSVLKGINVPIAPLSEQKRIVDKIESLFSRLDEAKDFIQKSLDEFEDRKAAVLHKAFNGELTESWRKEKLCIKDYGRYLLKDCCKMFSGGTPSRKNKDFYDGNIPWIKTGEINWNYIVDSEEKISELGLKNSAAKIAPKGSILLAMYGQGLTRGRAAVLDIEATTNQAVCVMIPDDKLYNKYLFYYFMANYWHLREKAVGGNQPNYNSKIIGDFVLYLPSIQEQQEIVRILDNFFEKEDKSKELLDMIDQIEEMKKSILARAFRGQLGTHSDDDEPAIELVKKILIEDNNVHCDKLEITKGKYKVREKKQMSKTILEALLSNGNKTTPEKLKQETGLTIDEFYERLKELVDLNKVREIKEEGESYLEVIDEDRPFKN